MSTYYPSVSQKRERKFQRRSLYLTVIDLLVDDIKKGKYPPGSKIPSEDQLSQEFAVSRVTLREALRALEEEGRIIRRQGRGTFICDRRIVPIQSLSKIIPISTMIKKAGLEDHISKICHRKFAASRKIAEKLNIITGKDVWEIERIRIMHEQPAIFSLDFIPASILPGGGEKKIKQYSHSLYGFLSEVCANPPNTAMVH